MYPTHMDMQRRQWMSHSWICIQTR